MESRISIVTLGVDALQKAYEFYHHGLGFPTTRTPEDGIVFFQTCGTCFALYPRDKLAEDVAPDFPKVSSRFPGITLAHNTKSKEVDEVLKLVEQTGGKIEKHAQIVSFCGYSGYFSDPDGYLWEVAWADFRQFNHDGSLVITWERRQSLRPLLGELAPGFESPPRRLRVFRNGRPEEIRSGNTGHLYSGRITTDRLKRKMSHKIRTPRAFVNSISGYRIRWSDRELLKGLVEESLHEVFEVEITEALGASTSAGRSSRL